MRRNYSPDSYFDARNTKESVSMKNTFIRFLVLSLVLWLVACATTSNPLSTVKDAYGDEYVFHSFTFNAIKDSPNVDVLDFRYGSSKNPGVRPDSHFTNQGKSDQGVSVTGRMLRGDSLYVKWRIKDSGKEYEDTVDLKSRLPRSIKDQRIYFIIDGAQLYVYLISLLPVRDYLTKDEAREDDEAIDKTRHRNLGVYARNSVTQIYPTRVTIYPYQSKK
jgi:hypothetical protein